MCSFSLYSSAAAHKRFGCRSERISNYLPQGLGAGATAETGRARPLTIQQHGSNQRPSTTLRSSMPTVVGRMAFRLRKRRAFSAICRFSHNKPSFELSSLGVPVRLVLGAHSPLLGRYPPGFPLHVQGITIRRWISRVTQPASHEFDP